MDSQPFKRNSAQFEHPMRICAFRWAHVRVRCIRWCCYTPPKGQCGWFWHSSVYACTSVSISHHTMRARAHSPYLVVARRAGLGPWSGNSVHGHVSICMYMRISMRVYMYLCDLSILQGNNIQMLHALCTPQNELSQASLRQESLAYIKNIVTMHCLERSAQWEAYRGCVEQCLASVAGQKRISTERCGVVNS
jgi:hypothetical protein